jgi:hypothetical protein
VSAERACIDGSFIGSKMWMSPTQNTWAVQEAGAVSRRASTGLFFTRLDRCAGEFQQPT